MRFAMSLVFVLLGSSVVTTGCASSSGAATEMSAAAETPADRLMRLRAAVRTLREGAFAKHHAVELDQAEVWLQELERMDADADEEFRAVLADAVEGQLARIQAAFARRDATARLEDERKAYVARQERVTRLEAETGAR